MRHLGATENYGQVKGGATIFTPSRHTQLRCHERWSIECILDAPLFLLTLNRLESYNRQGWSRTSTYVPSIGTALLELPAGVSHTNRCVAGGFFAQVPTGVRINDQSYHFWHPMSINYTTQALAGFLIKVKMRRVPVSCIDLYRVGFLSVSTGSSARTISVRADAPRQN